ncbi:MAG TPA: twin-arginine translocation signal domain-containing protein [Iamia sp.]|nr:twin-arginine translocation signal domain-containing protein [Iamia sp.]
MLTPPQPTDLAAAVGDADATRRAFLKKVAIGGAAAAVATQVLPLDRLVPRAGAQEEGEEEVELTPDEERMTFLAGIALAGATVYRAAAGDETPPEEADEQEDTGGTTTTTTTLPVITVPALAEPVVEVLRVFGSHHSQQATALNGTIPTAVEVHNGTLVAEVRGALGTAADEAEVLGILRDLEERIAATHLQAIADLEDANDAQLVATALPIVSQHAVVLGLVGTTPTPLEELIPEEQATDEAFDEATYPADGTTAPEDTSGPGDEDANAGGEGVDPDTSSSGGSEDGTESSGGGADDGTDTGAGGAADPESEG